MNMSAEQYWPLVALIALPFLWWMQGRSYAGFGAKQRAVQTVVRSLVVLLLAAALMQPTWLRSGEWQSVVYLLDLSASVSSTGRSSAATWIAEANDQGQPTHVQLMAFSANVVALADIDALQVLAGDAESSGPPDEPSQPALDRSATNLELALNEARRQFAPHHSKRVVLMTDGRETAGDVANALAALQRDGIRVFTVPVEPRAIDDAWIDSAVIPDVVTADEPFPVDVEVFSQAARTGVLALSRAGDVLDSRSIQLGEGFTRVVLEGRLSETGTEALEVRLQAEADPFVENNRIRRSTYVLEPSRVLYVEGHVESQRYLLEALEAGGLVVDTAASDALPNTVSDLEPYAAVIFSDVSPEALNDEQMAVLSTYVGELGGGLVMAGGDEMYGEEGYADTTIEDILPITFSVKERPEDFALIIVLDKSWSMVGPKIELSKEASKAAVDVLADHHQIGVVAFNNSLDWPVLLQRASNREWIKNKISTIMPSGHTNIFPALEEAYLSLLNVPDHLKHVILLSDGRTYPDDYEGLLIKMADMEISVSTVAMGEEADRELLTNIADWGNGRSYFVEDATQVPQVFAQETRRATRPTLVEEPFNPIVKKNAEMFKGIDFSTSPPLRGYLSTQLKDTSEALLVSDEDDPILARWQFGLGRAVAFTSDVKNRWATEWLNWPGYGKFWIQVVRETMRGPEDEARALRVRRERDRVRITVGPSGDVASSRFDHPEISIVGPDSQVTRVELDRVDQGSYAATVPLSDDGDYMFGVMAAGSSETRRALLHSYPAEYRFLPPDVDLLEAVSRDTDGSYAPTIEQLFDDTERTTRPIALWPYLAAVALLLYLVDLLLRRVWLFDPRRDLPPPSRVMPPPARP